MVEGKKKKNRPTATKKIKNFKIYTHYDHIIQTFYREHLIYFENILKISVTKKRFFSIEKNTTFV